MRKVGGGGAQRAAAVGGARCSCCPARLGSARLRAAWRGLARIPPGSGTAAGLSRFSSSRRRDWGCPVPFPAQGGFGAVPIPIPPPEGPELPPTPHTHLFAAPLCCAGPRAPTFFGGGAGCSLRWARRALGDATTFVGAVWAKSRWRRAPPPPPGFVPLPMKLFPPLQTPARADWHFFSPVLWGFFSCLYLTPFSFFLFLSQRIFFPIGIPSPRSSSRFCRGMFWMLT